MPLDVKKQKDSIDPDIFHHLGLLALRLLSVGLLFFYELYTHVIHTWNSLWHQKSWDFALQVEVASIPLPRVVAGGIVIGIAMTGIAVVVGFFTRINSLFLTLIFGFLLALKLKFSAHFTPEANMLYIVLFVVLIIA
ncbi:MAG: hypothetical protein AAF226_02720, partial [Verrucomicrobiota bacterium]